MTETRVLLSAEQISSRLKELAAAINRDYQSRTIDAICILKGSMVFTADLVRLLTVPVRLHFIQVSSYGESTDSSGTISLRFSSQSTVEGRHVLILEDILDTGITLNYLVQQIGLQKPASLKVCVLLDKKSRRKLDFEADYCGFEIEDHFVVGYGLDYNELYRNLPYVAVLTP